jgi:hypothetical protein
MPDLRRETLLPAPHPDVIFGSLSDGAVLFATASEVYFGLSDVGSRVWELLPPARRTMEELCVELCRQYPDVPPGTIRTDVEELLADLLANGLVLPPVPEEINATRSATGGA